MMHEIESGLLAILTQKNLDNVKFRIDVVDDLPTDQKSGKFRLIILPESSTTSLNYPGACC